MPSIVSFPKRSRPAACTAANNGGCGSNGNCTIEATGKTCTCKPGWSRTGCATREPLARCLAPHGPC